MTKCPHARIILRLHSRAKSIVSIRMILLLLFTQNSNAQTLFEAYQLARQNDLVYKAQTLKGLAAKEVLPQTRALLLPSLSISGNKRLVDISNENVFLGNTPNLANGPTPSSGKISTEYTSHGYAAVLTQPLLVPQRWYLFKQGQALYRQSDWAQVKIEQDLVIRTSTAYFDVLRNINALANLENEKKAIEKQSLQVARYFKAGLVGLSDTLEIEAALGQIRVKIIRANNRLATARDGLATLTGTTISTIEFLPNALSVKPISPNSDQSWIEAALENNTELKIVNANVLSAKNFYSSVRSQYLPTLNLTGSYLNDSIEFGSTNKALSESTTITLDLHMNIFQGGSLNSKNREACLLLEQSKTLYLNKLHEVERRTKTLFFTIHADVQAVRMLELTLSAQKESLKSIKAEYHAGLRNIVDLLQAQHAMHFAERALTDATYDYFSNVIALKLLTGGLDKNSLIFNKA